jgi:hypothetical protein
MASQYRIERSRHQGVAEATRSAARLEISEDRLNLFDDAAIPYCGVPCVNGDRNLEHHSHSCPPLPRCRAADGRNLTTFVGRVTGVSWDAGKLDIIRPRGTYQRGIKRGKGQLPTLGKLKIGCIVGCESKALTQCARAARRPEAHSALPTAIGLARLRRRPPRV